MSVTRSVTTVLLLLLVSVMLSAEKNPRDTLGQARSTESPAEAVRLLESALPEQGEWRFFFLMEIAHQYSKQGNWTLAHAAVSRVDATTVPRDHTDRYNYWLGLTLEQTGDSSSAEKVYYDSIFLADSREPLVYLGYLRLASSGAEKILTAMDTALPRLRENDPSSWALSRYLGGLVAVREGEWTFASGCFSRFLSAKDPASLEYSGWATFYQGWSLYRLGSWEEAYGVLTVFLDTFPAHERIWQAATAAAFCALQTGRDPVRYADKAVSHAPTARDRAEGLLFKATILLDRGDHASAVRILLSVADGSATSGQTVFSSRARFMLGDIAFSRRNHEEAEKYWLMVYSDFPDDPLAEEALFRSAEQWYLQGDAGRAVQLFTRYRRNHPNGKYTDLVLKNGGESLLLQGQRDLAILWWESFITRFPKSPLMPRVLHDLVLAYRASGDFAAALRMARTYKHDYPREAEADRIDVEIETLELLNRGAAPDIASVAVEYNTLGGASTAEGRSRGLVLARMYLADTNRRTDGQRILESIIATLPGNTTMLSRADRAVYAGAGMLLANYFRDTGNYTGSSRAFLSAGTLYAPIDGERAAESLYGAVDSFLRAGRRGDAEKALETMRSSWPGSVWTQRALRLAGSE